MKLFHGKGSCSVGILVVLEELGFDYEVLFVDLAAGEQRAPEFLAINPKGKVPALETDDGSVITEWPAIASYLAASKPEAGLLPGDPLTMARTLEAVDYIVATMHMAGFTRIARPGNFTPNAADTGAVQARGYEILDTGMLKMDAMLADRDYIIGPITIADAALFYVERWVVDRLNKPLPANCAAHYRRMLARPTVVAAIKRAG